MILFDISSAAWKLDDFKHELWESSNIGIPWHDRESNDATIFGALVAWFIGLVSTVKFLNFLDTRKFCCNLPKIQTERQNRKVFCQKDAIGKAICYTICMFLTKYLQVWPLCMNLR